MPVAALFSVIACLAVCSTTCATSRRALPRLPLDDLGVLDGYNTRRYATELDSCERLVTVSGRFALSGSVGGRPLKAQLRVGTMLTGAYTRVESAAASGHPRFVVTASAEDATLLLPQERRVLAHQRFADVMEASIGIPLSADEVFRIFVCPERGVNEAWRMGDLWARLAFIGGNVGYKVFVHRNKAAEPWGMVAMIGHDGDTRVGWRADFLKPRPPEWKRVRLSSVDWSGATDRTFDVLWSIDEVEVNTLVTMQEFTAIPVEGATAITLQEIRRLGPLLLRSGRRD
jgi:hypothetical protein